MPHRVTVTLARSEGVLDVYEYYDKVVGLIVHGRTIFVDPDGSIVVRESANLMDGQVHNIPAIVAYVPVDVTAIPADA